MSVISRYHKGITSILEGIAKEGKSISQAAGLIAEAIAEDKVIFIGHGGAHSELLLEELFYRAGGLACVNPMMDEGVFLGHGATRATQMERMLGYGRRVIDIYGVAERDVHMIISSDGTTHMAIDEALEARERGANIIALSSNEFAEKTPKDHPSRHPSGHSLKDLADIFLDCHVPFGDALVELEGVEQKFGASSTVALAYLAHQLMAEVVNILNSKDISPPLWQSSNTPGGDEANLQYIEKYRSRVKHLG